MTVPEAVLEKLQQLPLGEQRKVLEFVQTLADAQTPAQERKTSLGRFAHRGVDLSFEEIEQARREAWAGFPRDFPSETGS